MALFGAYLDESEGKLNGVPILAIAGYVAFAEHWDAVATRWRDRLDADNIPEFHMTEYEGARGYFDPSRISAERARALFNDLLGIMQNDGLLLQPFAIWTDLREWGGHAAQAYPPMILHMSEIVAQSVVSSDGVVDIAYLADENLKHKRACLDGFDHVRKSGATFARNIASFGFGNSELFPHLQVADLLAFEVMKFQRNRLGGGPPLRYSMKALLKNRRDIPTLQVTADDGRAS